MIAICPIGVTGVTFDGIPIGEACRRLEEQGASAVGLNCARGPATMIPLMKEVRKACKVSSCDLICIIRCVSRKEITLQITI